MIATSINVTTGPTIFSTLENWLPSTKPAVARPVLQIAVPMVET